MPLKYYVFTYGCQMNKNDSEFLKGLLDDYGLQETGQYIKADLIILNTCAVRENAERKVYGRLHELNHYRQQHHTRQKIAVCGCMPQYLQEDLLKKAPFIDYIWGVNNIMDISQYLENRLPLQEQIKRLRKNRAVAKDNCSEQQAALKRDPGKRAWIPVMYGCDNFCSYCIVPYTRGREVSRSREDIFKEITGLREKGFSQIVLLGQNVNSYGKNLYRDYGFPELLADTAASFPWLEKIDFLTSHPKDVSVKLARVIASYPNINREIHFPVQHADDNILRQMKRGYTLQEYRDKVKYLRKIVPGICIGTDVIVGFPGETEKAFNTLLTAIREIGFDWVNTAAYSDRPGTEAAAYSQKLSKAEKKRRLNILNNMLKTGKDDSI